MAGKVFIADIKDRDRISGLYLVQQKQTPLNKNGKPYIAMSLMDRSGTIEARVWDNVEQISPLFDTGDFIEAQGTAVAYQGKLQLKIDKVRQLDPDKVDPEEFLPASPKDRGEMLNNVRQLVSKISIASLKSLLLERLDDISFRESFAKAPAAKTIHHAYLGGLLEHTLAVMELADSICELYPELNRDLLLAGGFLHDIGKIKELGHQRSFDYSDEGRLVGHIVIGAMMFSDWVEAHPDIPEDLSLKLSHMILSHHGSYEFGSPKRPKFTEALVLNYLDEMDSKIQTFKNVAEKDQGQKWSSYQRLFDRYLLLGDITSPAPAEESPATSTQDNDNSNKPAQPRTLRKDVPLTHKPLADFAKQVTSEKKQTPTNDKQPDLFSNKEK
jgi:3'-5' exoribonuclease